MPANDHLTLFARQLATWAEQIIENGRTPFRRVDLCLPLLTEEGPCAPPLTFWINRQSMIAGGLLFLPESPQQDFSKEAAAASALGLCHFATWETDQINIRPVDDFRSGPLKSLPLTSAEDPSIFHHRLYELIDELKLLSVTGRVAPGQESPYYLLNLILETETIAHPSFLEACRLRRSETSRPQVPDDEARDWNRLNLLRIFSLLNWHSLPSSTNADNLHLAIEEHLQGLPDDLSHPLAALSPAPGQNFPPESAIAYHHLLLRLRQVCWEPQSVRGIETLKQLIQHWYGQPTCRPETDHNRLMFHPRELAPVCQREVSQSAAQLAANRIWRFLHDSPQPAQEQGDAFQFNVPFTESRVHANFFENQRPDQSLRRWLTAHLRASWPNRHLTIPGDLPLWIIEATHLLGLTGTGAITELHLPAAWLKLMRGSAFNEVLFDNFTLLEIDATDTHRHLLKVKRGCDALETACLLPDSERRGIELGTEAATASARLLYALELPAELYRLYDEQILVPLQLDSDESVHLDALELYGTCHLGQKLWSIASPLPLPPAGETLLFEGAGCGWLVPEATYLQDLKHLQTTDVDSQLAQLLSLSPDLKITQDATRRSVPAPKPLNRTLADELLHQLEVEGIPHFPDTYLYRLETGPLANFRFTPPLNLKQEMLGEYELVDAAGSVLKIVGEETKDSLLLAATLGRNRLELPEDRQQTAAILDSYRDDLRSLSQKIDALCLKHTDQPQAATRLHRKLWQQLNLPSLKWLSG